MEYIKLGNSDLKVPRIGLGCLHIGEKSLEERADVLRTAMDLGINLFDQERLGISQTNSRLFKIPSLFILHAAIVFVILPVYRSGIFSGLRLYKAMIPGKRSERAV